MGAGVPHPVAAKRSGEAKRNFPLAVHLLKIHH